MSAQLQQQQQQQQNNKDISKVFQTIREKLNEKEKELLQLQRANPCLIAPDATQIEKILDLISSIDLTTQDGSFSFQSHVPKSSSTDSTGLQSSGIDSIKTLPSSTWLSPSNDQQNASQYRLPMVTHLFSLPTNAFLQPKPTTATTPSLTTNEQKSFRLPMVDQLFSMPITAFTSKSNNQVSPSPSIEKKADEPVEAPVERKKESANSLLDRDSVFAKEHWLKRATSDGEESDFVSIDMDEYIEQSSEKLRRLHLEYTQALEKLNTPVESVDPTRTMKTLYPKMFERIKK